MSTEHTLITEPDASSLAARAAGFVADRIRAAGHRRMTLTYPALARAEEILWLVTGASKHDALAATSPFPPPACRPGDR